VSPFFIDVVNKVRQTFAIETLGWKRLIGKIPLFAVHSIERAKLENGNTRSVRTAQRLIDWVITSLRTFLEAEQPALIYVVLAFGR